MFLSSALFVHFFELWVYPELLLHRGDGWIKQLIGGVCRPLITVTFFQKHFPRQLELTVLTEKYSTELCELWVFIPHVFSFCLSFFPPVRYLLRNNVSPDLCNEDGLTALHQVRPTLWQGTEILWSLRQEYEERFQTIICSKDIEWSKINFFKKKVFVSRRK